MATDLTDRAEAQLERFEQHLDAVASRLEGVRRDLTVKHPAPDTVARADWATQLGADQHRRVAKDALAANRAQQAVTRASLAGVTTPAQAGPQGDTLADLLVDEAALRVEVRAAEERVAVADALIAALAPALTRAQGAHRAAEAAVAWGTTRQEAGARLRAALGDAPLDTIVADAAGLRASAAFTDANDRLDDLLPSELRTRATSRAEEAAGMLAATRDALELADTTSEGVDAASRPRETAVGVAEQRLAAAEGALEGYLARAAGRLDAARSALARVAAHADLTAAQVAALDAANRAAAVTALGQEDDLASAVTAASTAQQAVDDALLAAAVADVDADPEADAAVIAARAALADAAIQGPLTAARAAYDTTARNTVDEWEVEVPPSLWTALTDFLDAEATLDELADQAARDALVAELDAATDALAAALDERDVAARTGLALDEVHATRGARLLAVELQAGARRASYLQGDGPAGRTAAEL